MFSSFNAYSEQDSAGRSGSICGYSARGFPGPRNRVIKQNCWRGSRWGGDGRQHRVRTQALAGIITQSGVGVGGLSGSERGAVLLAALAAVTSFCLPARVPGSWAP